MNTPMNFTCAHITQDAEGSWRATCQFWGIDGVSYTWAQDNFKDHIAAKAWVEDLKAKVDASPDGEQIRADTAADLRRQLGDPIDDGVETRREAALFAGAVCSSCGHGRSSHGNRSGLCGVDGCECEGMPNAFTHEVYADYRDDGGYQGACHTCSWRGARQFTKPEAWDDALVHGREAGFQKQAAESIGAYAARMARERDEVLEVLADLYVAVQFDDVPADLMAHAEVMANLQLAAVTKRAVTSVERSHGETAGRLVTDGDAAGTASRGSAERPDVRPGFEYKRDRIYQLSNGYWAASILLRGPDDRMVHQHSDCFHDKSEAEAWVDERRVAYGIEPGDAA